MRGGYEMKYKRIIFISLLLSLICLTCLFVFAEKEAFPIITWDKTFGGRLDDGAASLIQTTDGGYAIAGRTNSKGAGHRDFWVIKLDKQGNISWDRTFGGSNDDWAASLIQTTDGGYAVAGATSSKGAGGQDWQDFWIIKLASYSGVEEIPSSTLQEGKLWEDIRIGIIVNKVEKAVVLSPEITEELGLFLKEMPKPAKGNDLVCIQLTIVKITNVHVISLGGRDDEKSFLTDDEGHKYRLNFCGVKGVEFLDPSDIRSPSEFIEGSRCILLFEMPKRKEPANLTFLYYFKEAWEDALSKKGQIDIKIQ